MRSRCIRGIRWYECIFLTKEDAQHIETKKNAAGFPAAFLYLRVYYSYLKNVMQDG